MSKDLSLAAMVFVMIMTCVICTYKYSMKKLDSPLRILSQNPIPPRTITLPSVSNYENINDDKQIVAKIEEKKRRVR